MRASLQRVAAALKSSRVPDTITQEPFDHDPGHYKRLCNLHGSQPSNSDLIDYALDMMYMELQPELLRHLMPVLFGAWRRDLFEGDPAGFAAFVEYFWPAMLKGKAFHQILTDSEFASVMHYMRDSILDRLDIETLLNFSGMSASPYGWIRAFVSVGVLFPSVESLWNEWWQMKTPGHAVSAFQYASALLYDADNNPVFTPWTPDEGGGPPAIWDCGCHMFDVGWREENLSFLKATLTSDYVEEKLVVALGRIEVGATKQIASRIIHELPSRRTLLALRIEELPKLLADVSRIEGFTI